MSDSTTLNKLAESTMKKLKHSFPDVFKEPKFPIKRKEAFQHKIRRVDNSAPPPKRKLYPLAGAELDELKK